MRAKSLLVRSSAIIIPCAHVLIVISLFFPFAPYQESVSTSWQWFLRPSGPGHLDLYSIARYDMLIVALALPPLASVVVFRSPTRMMGLLGVWISLPSFPPVQYHSARFSLAAARSSGVAFLNSSREQVHPQQKTYLIPARREMMRAK